MSIRDNSNVLRARKAAFLAGISVAAFAIAFNAGAVAQDTLPEAATEARQDADGGAAAPGTALESEAGASGQGATPGSAQDATSEESADAAAPDTLPEVRVEAAQVPPARRAPPARTVDDVDVITGPPLAQPAGQGVGGNGQSLRTTAPTFEAAKQEMFERPGGQSAVSRETFDTTKLTNQQDILRYVPGVIAISKGTGDDGFYSIRGSDIASSGTGARNGRGIKTYIDGIPLGRSNGGSTPPLVNVKAVDYVEVFRGPSALQFGTAVLGGVINYIPKKGLTYQGNYFTAEYGGFGYQSYQGEAGGVRGNIDYYAEMNYTFDDGYREHSEAENTRISTNVGIQVTDDIDTRFYATFDNVNQELAGSIPLNQLDELLRSPGVITGDQNLNIKADTDRNWGTFRFANKTAYRVSEDLTVSGGAYYTRTMFDHLPTPFAGFIDNIWNEVGSFVDVDRTFHGPLFTHRLQMGSRGTYSWDREKRNQWQDMGQSRGERVADWDRYTSSLEGYIEDEIELNHALSLFVGAQAHYSQLNRQDNFFAEIPGDTNPNGGPLSPQPGSLPGEQEYDEHYRAFNPKVGVTFNATPDIMFFGNVARSYEPPSGADLGDVVSLNATQGTDFSLPSAQTAWTYEAGTRGQLGDRLSWDLTYYNAGIHNEILTACAVSVDPFCNTTFAFNATRTIHQGVEFGGQATLFDGLLWRNDDLTATVVYNYNDFRFDDDPTYGNNRMPNVPMNTLFSELIYRDGSGFYVGANVSWLDKRRTTFDGSGGDAFIIPSYTIWGAKAGYEGERFEVSIVGENLGDLAYASQVTPLATVPSRIVGVIPPSGPPFIPTFIREPQPSPLVQPGAPAAVWARVKIKG